MIPGLKKRVFNLHDVMMYVALGRKHLRLMTLIFAFTLVAALTYYVYAKSVFYSRALVRVDELALPMDTEKIYNDGRLRMVMKELTQPHILERTAKRLGIKATSNDLRKNYLFKIGVRTNSERNLEIEVWPYSKDWAQRWTETLVAEYLDFRREKRLQEKEDTIKALTKEMAEVSAKLEQHIGEKFDYSDKKGMVQALIQLNSIRSLPLDLARLAKRIDEMGRIRVNLQDSTLSTLEKLSLVSSLDKSIKLEIGTVVGDSNNEHNNSQPQVDGDGNRNPNQNNGNGGNNGVVVIPPMISPASQPWEDLEKQQRSIKSQISDLGRTFLPGHSRMIALNKALEGIDQKLEIELQTSLRRFDVEFQDLLDQKSSLTAKLPEYNDIRRNSEKLTQEQSLHEAGQLAWNTMFRKMAKTIEALDFGGEKERVDLAYIGLLQINDQPISPNRLKLFAVALFFGVILSLAVPFLIEYLDHTMSNLEQVESTFQLRGLGIVPKLEGQTSHTPALIDRDETRRASLVENFRVIRTNLLSMGTLTKVPQVTMVTSAMPKEGKTVVSSNLAISFAHTGGKTLLVDTDLRRGRMHRLFGYRKAPGLSNVLLDEVSLEEAIRPTTHENLFVLTAGKHLDTGTELLGSQKFTDLMDTLRSKFERIVIDTPPVLGLSETSILQKQVDGVLFVIWSGHTPIRNMKAAIEMLQSNGANFYGFVLNRLDLSATTNYYQYYYYSYDYYYNTQAIENS